MMTMSHNQQISATEARPYFPNYGWLKKAKNRVQYVVAEINGQPNPSRLSLEQEIAEFEANIERWEDLVDFAKSRYGYSTVNKYAITKGVERHEPYKAFCGKFPDGLRCVSIDQAWHEFLASR
jgi:hypothetical protein